MRYLPKILQWEYGFERRHHIVIVAALVGFVDLYVANTVGSVPPWLALFALLAPLAGVLAFWKASVSELKTIAAWCVLADLCFGGGALLVRPFLAPGLTLNQFQTTHSFGVFMTTIAAVGLFTCVEALVMAGIIRFTEGDSGSGSGGSRNATPEERVLTEEEYEDFEPIETISQFVSKARLRLLKSE